MIRPTDRIINTNAENIDFRNVPTKHQETGAKPRGIWYAMGDAWLKWIAKEMPYWTKKPYNYKIEVNLDAMLVIDTAKKVDEFVDEYAQLPHYTEYIPASIRAYQIEIVWSIVCEKYSGIEMNPYFFEMKRKYKWYDVWDVPSGCIWKEDAIKRLLRIPND